MNLLFITTDQQRFDFYDNRIVETLRTPNIRSLMERGTTFSQSYATCPVCMAARFTWLHGLYASQVSTGLSTNTQDWPEPSRYPTMAQALQGAGYRTALIGKLHTMAGLWHRDVVKDEAKNTHNRGFHDLVEVSGKSVSYWYDCAWTRHLEEHGLLNDYRIDLRQRDERGHGWRGAERVSILAEEHMMDHFIADQCIDWLEQHCDDEQDWFLHASLCGPHFPIDPLPTYLEHYHTEDMPAPEGLSSDDPRIESWKKRRAHYCAVIEHVDSEIGRILKVLEDKQQLDDTLIIFTTDHGDMMGHHNRSNKSQAYDTSSRTPIIIAGPNIIAGREINDTMVESCDIPSTFLQVAGLNPDETLGHTPSRSFLDAAQHHNHPHRNWAYSECGPWRMVRNLEWKYVQNLKGNDALYHMTTDPWEEHNLIDDLQQSERISAMRHQLIEHLITHTPPDVPANPKRRDDWFDAHLPDDLELPTEPWDK